MAKLYLENGYFNYQIFDTYGTTFNFCIGGRGTGKTFGILKHCIESKEKFMLMRLTPIEVDMIKTSEFSPFVPIDETIVTAPINKHLTGVYYSEEVVNKKGVPERVPAGDPLGYICALTSVKNIRGFNSQHIKRIILDEFIPEKSARKRKFIADAFLNMYETINRNRELEGIKPVTCYCMANAFNLANDITDYLKLTNKLEKMAAKKKSIYYDQKKSICVALLYNSPISEKKKDTALYKLTSGTDFEKMALSNAFAYNDVSNIKSLPLPEYKPVFRYDGITCYKHKSKYQYYICHAHGGTCKEYPSGDTGRKRAKRDHIDIYTAFLDNVLYFESFDVQNKFESIFT